MGSIEDKNKEVDEAVNLAKNAKNGNVIGAAKNAINLMNNKKIKKRIKWKIILGIVKLLIPLLIIIIIASSLLSIFTSIADKMNELQGNIVKFTTNVWKWFSNDYWINIEKDIDCVVGQDENGQDIVEKETLIKQYMAETEKMGISIKKLRLLGDADYTSDEVMNDENNIKLMEKYLKEFIRADIISQEIHRRRGNGSLVNPLNENEIDGGVYLYRSENELSSGGDLQKARMTYVTKDDFDKKMQSNDEGIKQEFTVDEETGELIYAQVNTIDKYTKSGETWVFQERKVTLEEKKCDYKNVISKYILPYEFLANLCMVTQNPEFVYRVAMMARKTEINLVILDNSTETTDIVEEEITTTTLTNNGSSNPIGATSSESTAKTGTKTITAQTNPQVVVEKVVDSWIYKGEKKYTNNIQESKTGPNESVGETESMPSALQDTGTTVQVPAKDATTLPGSSTASIPTNIKDKVDVDKKITVKVYSASYISEHKITTTVETKSNNYDEGVVENEIIKSDDFLGLLRNKDGEVISENEFKDGKRVSFLKEGENVSYIIPNSTISEMPLNRLISGAQMLFGILRRNTKTESQEQIMRYLLQFPTGNDYNVTSEDIENLLKITNPSSGSVADGGIIVKIDESGAAPAVTREQLIQIINSYFKGQQRTNAISVVNALIEGQNQYKVNAVFELAILKKETSVGTARTKYVSQDNNWTSYNLGYKYSTPSQSVLASMKSIGTGSYYFTKGKYTIKEIGYTYCPNQPSHPTQGDDWVASVSSFVVSMYNSIGVQIVTEDSSGSISTGNGGGTEYTSSSGKKYIEYKQFDAAWANKSFAGGTMKNSGCSLSAVAVILTGYGKNVSPESLRQSVNGQMTNLCTLLSNNGVASKRITHKLSSTEIIEQLKTGKPIIVLVGKPWASSNAHYMCLLDYKSSGSKNMVYVSNPGKNASHYNGWYDVDEISPYTLPSAGSIFITQ